MVPYGAFLALVQVEAWLPEPAAAWMLPIKVLLPLALLGHYWQRGRYPELSLGGSSPRQLAGDVAFGLGLAALWMAPYVWEGGLSHPPPGGEFDPDAMGPALRSPRLALRLLGFGLVTPFVEELFVRSFLLRGADLVSLSRTGVQVDEGRDFRDLPIGIYTHWSFALTVLYFTFSHVAWEWPVAFASGILFNLWLYHRRNLGALVVVHATTNIAIFLLVWGAAARGRNLWFFL